MSRQQVLMAGAAMALVLQAASAFAQEEIIVTARKRDESILNVPVVETVLTQKALEQYAIADLQSVATRVPGMSIGASSTGSYGSFVFLRGVGTTTSNSAVDQSVSLNLDGLNLSQGLSYRVGFFDVGQVEVLKGPQALFYGKASTAGVISVRTADPTNTPELIGRVGYEAEAREKTGELVLSGPIDDGLKMRLSTRYAQTDGFFKNRLVNTPSLGGLAPTDSRGPNSEEFIIRGTILWEPSDRFNLRLKVNHDKLWETNYGQQLGGCPDGTGLVPGAVYAYIAGEDCKLDRYVSYVYLDPAAFPAIRNGGVPFNDIKQTFGTGEANYRLTDALNLTSVTGYYKVSQSGFNNSVDSTGPGSNAVADTDFQREDQTEEVRLTSNFKDVPVDFVLGTFYQNFDLHFHSNFRGNILQGLPDKQQVGDSYIHGQTVSAFGQLIWHINSQFELAGGARWTHEKRSMGQINTITGVPVTVLLGVPAIKSNRGNPEASLTYKPTDDMTLFASYKQANKSGSFNPSVIVANGTDTSFKDEGAKGGEVGLKSRWLDRRFNINLAGYYYKFTNLQVNASGTLPNGVLTVTTFNAASAKTYGLDLDMSYRPESVDGLTLNGAINWNRARYISFPNAQCWSGQTIVGGCSAGPLNSAGRYQAQDLSGRPLVRAPSLTATFGFNYERPIGNDMTFVIGSSTSYSGKYYTNVTLRDDTIQHAYAKTDLSLMLRGPRDGYEISLIGKNLGNVLTKGICTTAPFAASNRVGNLSGTNTLGPGGVDELACVVDRGRELWMTITVRPFAIWP